MDGTHSSQPDPRIKLLEKEIELAGVHLPLPRWAERRAVKKVLMEQLLFALVPHIHEKTVPAYGCLVMPRPGAIRDTVHAPEDVARMMADGQSTFVLYERTEFKGLAVFDDPLDSEFAMVQAVSADGAIAICRDRAGRVTFYSPYGALREHRRVWRASPNVDTLVERLEHYACNITTAPLRRLLKFALHGLSPQGIGATLVWVFSDAPLTGGGRPIDLSGIDLGLRNSAHVRALSQLLSQIDGATIFDHKGRILSTGVHLRPSDRAIGLVPPHGGTRHTSAKRFSYERDDAILVVVSEDGPVSVFAGGARLAYVEPYSAATDAELLRELVPEKAGDVFHESRVEQCKQCGKWAAIEVVTVLGWKDREVTNCPVCGKFIAAQRCFRIEAVPVRRPET
jgi:hypothetical protein